VQVRAALPGPPGLLLGPAGSFAIGHLTSPVLFLDARSGGRRQRCYGRRDNFLAAGEERPGVIEQHDAVAEQAPPLLGMTDRHVGGHAVRCRCLWAPGLVLAHTVLRYELFLGAAALPAERPVDRDDCASAHCRQSPVEAASGNPADGKPCYRLARTRR